VTGGSGTPAGFAPEWLAAQAGGRVLQPGAGPAHRITTDSRTLRAGDAFVALRGPTFDGHRFVGAALAGGAAGLVVERLPEIPVAPERFVVLVPDAARALAAFGAGRRRQLARVPVAAITGSCGKTTTKDMLARMLAAAMPVVGSERSFNNHLGVPLTLLRMQPETAAAVVEIGTNAPGEIALLAAIAQPDIAIVTCVAPAHLEKLGSLAGVAAEKGALVESVPPGGLVILNADDPLVAAMAARSRAEVRLVRIGRRADAFATEVDPGQHGVRFRLDGELPVLLPGLARHHVVDALLALLAAERLGVPRAQAIAALAQHAASPRRLERHVAAGVTVLDDTYNMNPASARAALQALADLRAPGRSLVVFGEMLELGSDSEPQHRALGAAIAAHEPHALLAVGAGAAAIADGACAAGLPARRVSRADSPEQALPLLRDCLQPGDAVLLKASRRVGLDRLVDRLLDALRRRDAPAASRVGTAG
jgi:UDP-N-acetylmuramoyl-tripeptide--D-alanyl-D-alanine ligase